MRPALRDPELEAQLERDGFVVVPFLDAGTVASLRSAFGELVPERGFGSHYTSASSDVAYREAAFQAIAAAFAEPLERTIDRFRPVVANFFAKEPAPGTSLVVHQDWAFVDEATSRSLNIWCPLEDATAENGTLLVLPGSHRPLDLLRGTSEGAGGLPSPFDGIEDYVTDRYLVPISVPAGMAIINDHRLIHASGSNGSSTLRVAASLTLVPVESAVTHAFGRSDGTVEIYELADEQLRAHRIGQAPDGRVVATTVHRGSALDPAQFDEKFGHLLVRSDELDTTDHSRPRNRAGRIRHVLDAARRTVGGRPRQ